MRKKIKDTAVYGVVILLLVSVGCDQTEIVEGKGSLNITNTLKISESSPSISSDGKKVVFEADLQGNKEIILKDLETGEVLNISNSPAKDYKPSISDDGKKIVFMSDRTGNLEAFVVNLADVFYMKGMQSKKQGNIERAVSYFKRAANIDPFHIPSHHQLGTIYDETKDYDKAIEEFNTVTKLYKTKLLISLADYVRNAGAKNSK